MRLTNRRIRRWPIGRPGALNTTLGWHHKRWDACCFKTLKLEIRRSATVHHEPFLRPQLPLKHLHLPSSQIFLYRSSPILTSATHSLPVLFHSDRQIPFHVSLSLAEARTRPPEPPSSLFPTRKSIVLRSTAGKHLIEPRTSNRQSLRACGHIMRVPSYQ
jgi:hypothetical protein